MNKACWAPTALFGAIACVAVYPTAALTITKTVSPESPSAGQPVEFTITVVNDEPAVATDIHITEQLPSGLMVTAGMAVFVSQGAYDTSSGDWALGDLEPAGEAIMTVPAALDAASSPGCVTNEAMISAHVDFPDRTGSSTATVRRPGVDACVDLVVQDALFTVPEPFCSDTTSATLSFSVQNRGTDMSQPVEVSVSQNPARIPGFGFISAGCGGSGPLSCTTGALGPGAIRVFTVYSDEFNNSSAYPVTLTITATSSDADLNPASNTLVSNREVPRTIVSDCPIPEQSIGIGSPSCFIATAAWGTPFDKHVLTLRQFRDRHLLTSNLGRRFVTWYYHHSPPLAAFIAERPAWRAATRAALMPVVVAIRFPMVCLTIVMCLSVTVFFIRRRVIRITICMSS